jgi:hypothetical protein
MVCKDKLQSSLLDRLSLLCDDVGGFQELVVIDSYRAYYAMLILQKLQSANSALTGRLPASDIEREAEFNTLRIGFETVEGKAWT